MQELAISQQSGSLLFKGLFITVISGACYIFTLAKCISFMLTLVIFAGHFSAK